MFSWSKIIKLTSFFFIAFLVFSALFPQQLLAQSQTGLSLSPLVFELNADPGDVVSNQIKVYNPTSEPLSVKIKVEDFSPVGDEGQVAISDPGENETFSIASWTTVSTDSFIVGSKQQKIFSFTVVVPENAEPGGHYGSIGAIISGGSSQTTGSSVTSEVASLVLLRVSGQVEEEVLLDTFDSAKDFYEYGPVDFSIKFKNTGNVHVRPAGFITITDTFGKQVAIVEIPQNNVIPGALRKADVSWGEKNLFGRYTATVVANYGLQNKKTVTEVVSFTVVPWKKVALVVGIILAVALFLFVIRKRLSRAFKVLIKGN